MNVCRITTPLNKEMRKRLKVGDTVLLNGIIFTARDVAHKKFLELLKKGMRLPFPIRDASIFYAGPTPAPKGMVIGSCGPTTSSRVDIFTPALLRAGAGSFIGKGRRSDTVRREIARHSAVYFLAMGGAGALISLKITDARPIAFKELGPEAVYMINVRDFPLIVGIDTKGNDIYSRLG